MWRMLYLRLIPISFFWYIDVDFTIYTLKRATSIVEKSIAENIVVTK